MCRIARDVVVITRAVESFSIAMLSQTYNQVEINFMLICSLFVHTPKYQYIHAHMQTHIAR